MACALWPQALAPRMVRPRRDGLSSAGERFHRRGLHGPRRDRVHADRPTLVGNPQGSIHMLFHQHVGGPDRLVDLIEPALVRDGKILAQAAGCLEAQDAVQLPVCRTGAMQIRRLRGLNGEAPVVDRQIAVQKPIRRLQGRDPCQAQLLDPSILNGLIEPLHPSLRLRGVGRDQLDS